MRSFFHALSLFLAAQAWAGPQENRGFSAGKCYRHVVRYSCRTDCSACGMDVFPWGAGRLTFGLMDPTPRCRRKPTTVGLAGFSLSSDGGMLKARIYSFTELPERTARLAGGDKGVDAHPEGCPL